MNLSKRLEELRATVDKARQPLNPDARMAAYYYSFDRTGCGPVDAVLSAVAVAGKGAHNTEEWTGQNNWGYYDKRPGLPDNPYVKGDWQQEGSALNLIERTAARSASEVAAALAAADKALRALAAVQAQIERISRHTEMEPEAVEFRDAPNGVWYDVTDVLTEAIEEALK